jgi:hypothetical protein
MPDVTGFLPSVQGLPFTNSFPPEPDLFIDLPGIGRVGIGDASNGLCGGMVYTVLDMFNVRLKPPTDPVRPSVGEPLYGYIVRRLFDSFDLPGGPLTYLDWMVTPDHDTGLPPFLIRRGLAWRTIVDQLPAIKSDVDMGCPSTIALVTVQSANPGDLGQNHQVLVYGYDDDGSQVTLKVYDPNTERLDADNVRISFPTTDPEHTTPITHNVNIPHPIRGFFRTSYTPVDPRGGVEPQPAKWWQLGPGRVPVPAGDQIEFELQQGALDPSIVEFRLEAGPGITWRKTVNVPDGLGSSWDIWTQDGKSFDAVSLWAGQVNNGQSLTFTKAGFLGTPHTIGSVGDLEGMPPGSRLVLRWLRD